MNDLFRFLVLRSPRPAAGATVDLGEGESRFLISLGAAHGAQDPAHEMRALAAAFAGSEQFLRDVSDAALGAPLLALRAALDSHGDAGLEALAALATSTFGQSPGAVVGTEAFRETWVRVRDSIVAVKLAPETATPALASLVDAARLMALVRRIAGDDASLDRPGAVAVARAALLVLPPAAVPPQPAPAAERPAARPDAGTPEERRAMTERIAALKSAIEAIRAIETTPEAGEPPRPETGPSAVRPPSGAEHVRSARTQMSPIRDAIVEMKPVEVQLTHAEAAALPEAARAALGIRSGELPVLTHDQAEMKLMEAYKLELAGAVGKLTAEIGAHAFLPDLHMEPVALPGEHDDATDPPPAVMTGVPKTHGTLKPAGVGDLLVTRQHTVRYETGEVAHIENVAAGEELTRETKRLDTTETTTVVETETFQNDERDLQTTGRFNLHQETDRIVKHDNQRIPGQPSSESYGSLVESAASQHSTKKEAETYSRDITSRAASRITQRMRTQITTRALRELEDKATHKFAADNDARVIVYQWIDQIVQSQVFSYGKRLFYDIVVPEPGAFLARALESRGRELPMPPRPAPFTLQPTHLSEWNWPYYVAGYGATGVSPTPPPHVTIARTLQGMAQNAFSGSDELRFAMASTGLDVPIPEGYRAHKVRVRVRWFGWDGFMDLVVGNAHKRFVYGTDWSWQANLLGETGSIPVTAMVPEGLQQFTIAIEVLCELTTERMERWQAAAILAASREREDQYEQRLTNLRASLRLLTAGQPVERKRQMIRSEIQKSCLAVMTDQQFDGLSAVAHSPQGYPQPFLPNIEPYGRYVRFLENAFEWEQMIWRYAPYFWGRKPYWIRTILRDDPDPELAAFFNAGAARALVPVRPGYQAAVLAFMADGTVPELDALTEITSPLYVPLLEELSEPDAAMEDGRPYSDPWEIRLPTTLVALRRDGTLPRWQQQIAADGTVRWTAAPGDPVP